MKVNLPVGGEALPAHHQRMSHTIPPHTVVVRTKYTILLTCEVMEQIWNYYQAFFKRKQVKFSRALAKQE
jgi:hypothetical protein